MKAIKKIVNSTREECIWTLSSIESYKKWTQTNNKKALEIQNTIKKREDMKNKTINEYLKRVINKAKKFTSVTSKPVKCFKYSFS